MGAGKLTVDDICAVLPAKFKNRTHVVPFYKLIYILTPFMFFNVIYIMFPKVVLIAALIALQVLLKLIREIHFFKKRTKIINQKASRWIEKTFDASTIPSAKTPLMSAVVYHSLTRKHFKLALPYFISVIAVVFFWQFENIWLSVMVLMINVAAVDEYFKLLMNYENRKPNNIVCSAIKLLAAKKKQ